jgi:hypothetical protein
MNFVRSFHRETFDRFAEFAGVKEQPLPMWVDLRRLFSVFAEQRVKLGRISSFTRELGVTTDGLETKPHAHSYCMYGLRVV